MAAQACRAGGHRARFGRSGTSSAGCPEHWREPADGVALATALCRSGPRGSVARPHPLARQVADRGRQSGPGGSPDVTQPPHRATHWTRRAMAKAMGLSLRSVQRIWQAHQLQPHRRRTFKRSRDLADIVGLYIDPPAHSVVLSLDDEKSQIQALDRTQSRLPIKPGRCQTMTHDYKRHGTTTLFAALSMLYGRGDRTLHAAPPPQRIHPFSQCRRTRGPAREADPRGARTGDAAGSHSTISGVRTGRWPTGHRWRSARWRHRALGETAVDVTCDAALGQRCRVAHIPTAPTTTTAGSDAMISDRRSGLNSTRQTGPSGPHGPSSHSRCRRLSGRPRSRRAHKGVASRLRNWAGEGVRAHEIIFNGACCNFLGVPF